MTHTTHEAGIRLVPVAELEAITKLDNSIATAIEVRGWAYAKLAAAPVAPVGGEGEVEQLLADLKKGRDKRETTDPVWSEFNRHIQTVEALAARAHPSVGEVVWISRRVLLGMARKGDHEMVYSTREDVCAEDAIPLYAHPAEPARDGVATARLKAADLAGIGRAREDATLIHIADTILSVLPLAASGEK